MDSKLFLCLCKDTLCEPASMNYVLCVCVARQSVYQGLFGSSASCSDSILHSLSSNLKSLPQAEQRHAHIISLGHDQQPIGFPNQSSSTYPSIFLLMPMLELMTQIYCSLCFGIYLFLCNLEMGLIWRLSRPLNIW